jgi:hypothetical protein
MLATQRDIYVSLALVTVYAFTALIGIPKIMLDAVLTQPMFTRIVWLFFICALLFTKHYLAAVLTVVLGLRVSFESHSSYKFSHDGILAEYAAQEKKDPRFDPASELDLKMANETLSVDPARWVDPGRSPIPLLLFPPTTQQLSLIGNNGK